MPGTHVKKSKIEKKYGVPVKLRARIGKKKLNLFLPHRIVSLFHRRLRSVLALLVPLVIHQTALSQVT
jgi:hypothetical protein